MAKFKITKQQVVDVIKKRWWIMLIELGVIAVILLADLLTKKYVVEYLFTQSGHSHVLIKGFINLVYTENTGAGFGLFAGSTVALTVVTTIVIVAVLAFLVIAQKENQWLRVSLLFIVGGGIGNLVDRIGLGYVRDFIQFAFWKDFAIFNIADSFVTVGVAMLVVVLIVMLVAERKKSQKEFEDGQVGKAEELNDDPLDAPVNLNPMMKSVNEYTFVSPDEVKDGNGESKGEKDVSNEAENALNDAYGSDIKHVLGDSYEASVAVESKDESGINSKDKK